MIVSATDAHAPKIELTDELLKKYEFYRLIKYPDSYFRIEDYNDYERVTYFSEACVKDYIGRRERA